ncbi:MAG TPA: hypothetical protein VFW53_09505 [Gallionella sp.]|nr:hypothetical protein [Gallionella sp.]
MSPEKFNEIAETIEDFGNAWIQNAADKKDGGSLQWDSMWKNNIRDIYENDIKKEIKLLSDEQEQGFLDRHKIAAAMFIAILRKEPLIAKWGSKTCLEIRDANLLLAIETGGLILFAFGYTEAQLTNNSALKKIYDSEVGFQFPFPCNGDSSYPAHLANTLRIVNKKSEPLWMAQLFFLLQRHFEISRAYELSISASQDLDHMTRRNALKQHLA